MQKLVNHFFWKLYTNHWRGGTTPPPTLSFTLKYIIVLNNKIKIISNYDANIYSDNKTIKKNLQNQMANRVNWTQSIKKLEDTGEKIIIEMGPNKILSGLIKRISNNFDIISINNISDIK